MSYERELVKRIAVNEERIGDACEECGAVTENGCYWCDECWDRLEEGPAADARHEEEERWVERQEELVFLGRA